MQGCGRNAAPDASCEATVAAVDDHPLILRGLQAYLAESVPCIRMTRVASTVDELFADPGGTVSVVLLDLQLGDGSIPEDNVRRIRGTGAHVVLYTSEHRSAVVRQALDAGAVGLILKEDPEARLVEAIRQARDGHFYVSSRLAHQVVTDPNGMVRLSEREREILALLARGLPWGAVARRLNISTETARTHCYRAMEKYTKSGGEPVNGPKDLVFRAIADGHVQMAPATAAVR
ncbi:MAG: response regulator transcription factor [Actinomycetota bacterium]